MTAPVVTQRGVFAAGLAGGGGVWSVASAGIVVIVIMPILSLVWIASGDAGGLWPHLAAYVLPQSLRDTTILLVGVGAVVAVVGTGTAWLVTAFTFPGRRALEWLLLLPLAMPTYIVAYVYLDMLHPLGPVQGGLRILLGLSSPRDLWFPDIRSPAGCILLMGLVLYPYVYLPTRALFLMQSACLLDAARTLGQTGGGTFLRIALPLARPAIAVGMALALMEALNDVGAAEFLGVRTLTVSIYATWINRSSLVGAAQIALVMLAFIALIIALERHGRRHQRYALSAQRARRLAPRRLHGWRACAAATLCLIPVMLGFVLPSLHLVQSAWLRVTERGLSPRLANEVMTTVTLSALATAVIVGLGLVVSYAARIEPRGPSRSLARLAGLGYALPGTVLAIGLLSPLAALDNVVAETWHSITGASPGLLITGSGLALIYAYAVRYLAISSGGIETGFQRVPLSLEQAARTLGESKSGIAWRIHLPLIQPAVLSAAILIFVDCMKELPATLLLRPLNIETLATHVYAEAARGTYEDGAVAALLIVVVGLLPITILARLSRQAPARSGSLTSSRDGPMPRELGVQWSGPRT